MKLCHWRFAAGWPIFNNMTGPDSAGPLTALYGTEVVTTYSGNPLNRLSFLREDVSFLNSALRSESSRIYPFCSFQPLVAENHIVSLPFSNFSSVIADSMFSEAKVSGLDSAQLVFLGLDEREPDVFQYDAYRGRPYFAIDTTPYPHATPALKEALDNVNSSLPGEFMSIMWGPVLPKRDYAIFAEARAVLDWINRTRFCAGCGTQNTVAHGGWKLSCQNSACPTQGRISNVCFPRTDCCIITAILSHDGTKVLIGRHKRAKELPLYTCVAGFLESGESLEDCVRREAFEETGVKIGRVLLYASQPWPYPANLMIGCIAEVHDASEESHEINLGHDPELADARWVLLADLSKACMQVHKTRSMQHPAEGLDFTVPPASSVAWVLLNAVANRGVNFRSSM